MDANIATSSIDSASNRAVHLPPVRDHRLRRDLFLQWRYWRQPCRIGDLDSIVLTWSPVSSSNCASSIGITT